MRVGGKYSQRKGNWVEWGGVGYGALQLMSNEE